MHNLFYNTVWSIGWPFVTISSHPRFLHRERAARSGGFILAPNHLSPYDVPCLMAANRRCLDFLSIVEMRRHPLAFWLFRRMNCVFMDRSRPDAAAVQAILHRLAQGRVICMFPEASIRTLDTSVLTGAPMRKGIGRLATLTNVPIVPCAIVGPSGFRHWYNWLPFRLLRYGVCFGEPIFPAADGDTQERGQVMEEQLAKAYRDLYAELCAALPQVCRNTSEDQPGRV